MTENEHVVVVLFDRKNGSRKNLSIEVKSNDNIESLLKTVELAVNIPSAELEVVFCGKRIDRSTTVKDLSLGPSTQLTLLRPKVQILTDANFKSLQPIDTSTISSFYVYCKSCESIKRGKLRVYCQNCSSNSVIVKAEPQNWSDVLRSKRIRVDCENCCQENLYAQFKFKCVDCNEICAALTHARGNWQLSECCVCGGKEKMIFDLGCNHPTCESCFKDYLLHTLSIFSFIYQPPHGYTISCPMLNCNRVVQDVHHFYVMGKTKYQEYQKKATEKLVALDDEGVVCPNRNCGQSFFWEPYDDDGRSQCPDCFYSFCRKCYERECICHKEDDLTKTTIDATTRKCPKCHTSTERNGGCSHIHCTFCGMDWCFKCVSEWTEECQWDHWF